MAPNDPLREHLAKILDWHDAHVDFDGAVEGIAPEQRGVQPDGLPYSPWQLLEHIRIAQHDILDFCLNPAYEDMKWPDDCWPKTAAPPTRDAWSDSIAGYRADRESLKRLAADPAIDLFARIPHGQGQTYLREVLLVADHTAYHVGQLVAVRRLLRIWPVPS